MVNVVSHLCTSKPVNMETLWIKHDWNCPSEGTYVLKLLLQKCWPVFNQIKEIVSDAWNTSGSWANVTLVTLCTSVFGSSFQFQANEGIFTQRLFLMVRQWFQNRGHAFMICHFPIRSEEDSCSIIVLGLKWSFVISLMLIFQCGLLALPRAAWLELQMACWAWQSVFCIFVCIWSKSLRDDRG